MHEMLGRVAKVLDGHPKLIDKFNCILPPGMPLRNFTQSDVAEVVAFSCWICLLYMYLDVLINYNSIRKILYENKILSEFVALEFLTSNIILLLLDILQ